MAEEIRASTKSRRRPSFTGGMFAKLEGQLCAFSPRGTRDRARRTAATPHAPRNLRQKAFVNMEATHDRPLAET